MSFYKDSGLADIYFEQFGGIKYFLSSTKVSILNTKLKFWNDVISSWLLAKTIITKGKVDGSEILSEPLFNNCQITYKGNILFFKRWMQKNVRYVRDIVDNNGLKSFDEVKEMVGNYPNLIFDYNACINSLPTVWKKYIQTQPVGTIFQDSAPAETQTNNMSSFLKKPNGIIRGLLSNDTNIEAYGRGFWLRKLNSDINEKFSCAANATKESKLRLLHFKLLHNIYPTNIMLKRMRIKNSENCDFCGEKDFIEHMFISCPKLKGFWDKIFSLIFTHTQVKFDLTNSNILLGISCDNGRLKRQINIANHVILISKFCISKMRYGEIKDIHLLFDIEWCLRKNKM